MSSLNPCNNPTSIIEDLKAEDYNLSEPQSWNLNTGSPESVLIPQLYPLSWSLSSLFNLILTSFEVAGWGYHVAITNEEAKALKNEGTCSSWHSRSVFHLDKPSASGCVGARELCQELPDQELLSPMQWAHPDARLLVTGTSSNKREGSSSCPPTLLEACPRRQGVDLISSLALLRMHGKMDTAADSGGQGPLGILFLFSLLWKINRYRK